MTTEADNQQSLLSSTVGKEYKVYPYRFVVSVLFSLSSAINAIMWICYSPITEALQRIYHVDLLWVNFATSLVWLAIYPPMNFVANYVLDELGLKWGIIFANIGTISGLWVRTLSDQDDGFTYIFIGQILGAIAQPCILNAPQKVSAVWYAPDGRTLSTTLLSVANPVGVGIGFVMTQFFVSPDADGPSGRTEVYNLNYFLAVLASIVLVPVMFLFKSKPPTPPSKAADTEKFSYKESLKNLMRNKNYIVFLFATGSIWGAYNVMAIVLDPLIEPFGFTSDDVGTFGGLNLLCGLVGSIVWGYYVEVSKKYKKSILICSFVSIGSLISLIPFALSGNTWLMGMGIVFFGFFTTPLLPLLFELCCEISFPVNEASSGGLMIMMTQFFAIAGTFIIDPIIKAKSKTTSIIGMGIVILFEFLGAIGYILTKEDLRRMKYEKKEGPAKSFHDAKVAPEFDSPSSLPSISESSEQTEQSQQYQPSSEDVSPTESNHITSLEDSEAVAQ